MKTKLIEIDGIMFKIQSYKKDERSHLIPKNINGIESGFVINFETMEIEYGYGHTTKEWYNMKSELDIHIVKEKLDTYFGQEKFKFEKRM